MSKITQDQVRKLRRECVAEPGGPSLLNRIKSLESMDSEKLHDKTVEAITAIDEMKNRTVPNIRNLLWAALIIIGTFFGFYDRIRVGGIEHRGIEALKAHDQKPGHGKVREDLATQGVKIEVIEKTLERIEKKIDQAINNIEMEFLGKVKND